MARPGLDRNVKFRMLCRLLGEPRPHVRGYLECLWDVAYENGDPIIGDSVAVEAASEYPGQPGKLFRALLECGGQQRVGFIEPVPNSENLYQVHDLFDHAPDYVQSRKEKEVERRKPKACDMCGGAYRSTERHSRFCSNACRVQSHRVTHGNEGVTHTALQVTRANAPPAPAPISSLAASAAKEELGKEPKTLGTRSDERPRKQPDELFLAVAEATASDASVSGSFIGRIAKDLRLADPPYTPDEVRRLPALLASRGFTLPITLGSVKKYVGWVRKMPNAATQRKAAEDAQRERDQRQREDMERWTRNRAPQGTFRKLRKEAQDAGNG